MDNFEHEGMLPSERQSEILELLRKRKSLRVSQLSKQLFINEATVRRDLNTLAKSGVISRTHGGAVLTEGLDSEIPFLVRQTSFVEQKRAIGKNAAEFVYEGNSVFLDSSSTTAFMIPHIREKKHLRIVTNGAKAVLLLSELADCEICCIGGMLRENSLSFAGSITEETLARFHFDAAFFSCRGVDRECGLTDSSLEEAKIRRIVISNSKKNFLLADRSKFDAVSFCEISGIESVSHIVTDAPPDGDWTAFLKEKKISVIY